MNAWEAAILGAIQGVTEFLPISSSGHVSVLQILFGMDDPEENLFLTLLVHTASLVAVLIYFRERVWQLVGGVARVIGRPAAWARDEQMRFALLIVVSTLATGPAILLKDVLQSMAESLAAIGVAFFCTAAWLWLSRRAPETPRVTTAAGIAWHAAILLGVAQLAATTPGISRSGTTIVAALLLGWARPLAFTYSFFMAIPAILIPMALVTKDILAAETAPATSVPAMGIAFVASLATSLVALVLLRYLVAHGQLYRFAYYLVLVGALCLWGAFRS